MRFSRRAPEPIHGHVIPPRHFTGWAALYFVLFVCVPLLGAGLLLDVALYTVFRDLFDACYAIMCLFE